MTFDAFGDFRDDEDFLDFEMDWDEDDDYDGSDCYDEDGDGDSEFFEDEDDYNERNGIHFADPSGHSALRAATRSNPRNLPCPNCDSPNRLTPADVERGYQCDRCADLAESGRGY